MGVPLIAGQLVEHDDGVPGADPGHGGRFLGEVELRLSPPPRRVVLLLDDEHPGRGQRAECHEDAVGEDQDRPAPCFFCLVQVGLAGSASRVIEPPMKTRRAFRPRAFPEMIETALTGR